MSDKQKALDHFIGILIEIAVEGSPKGIFTVHKEVVDQAFTGFELEVHWKIQEMLKEGRIKFTEGFQLTFGENRNV